MFARNISVSGLLFVVLFLVFSILFGDNLSRSLTQALKGREKVATIVAVCIISFLSANTASLILVIFRAALNWLISLFLQ